MLMQYYTIKFVRDIRKYFPYAVRSAKADLRSEVAESYLNWLWWLIEPMCTMLIYAVIFGIVFNASEKYFPIFIYIGITMWGFFSKNVIVSVNMVRTNRAIITRVYMPKFILMLSRMFVNAFKMLVSFGVILLMMLYYHVHVTWNVLYVLPILVILFMFTFGVSMLLMNFGVYVNDLGYIVGIALNLFMYFTGIFYSISKRIPAPIGIILEAANPLAFLIAGMRNVLIYGMPVSIAILAFWGLVSIIIIAIGLRVVYKNENSYVKVI